MGPPTALAIGLVLAIAIFGVIANHAREMYRDKKYREMFGTLFWAVVPIAVFCIFWVANENPTIMARNITLGLVGAVLGAVALIWIGYVAHEGWADALPHPTKQTAIPPSTSVRTAFSQTQSIKIAPPSFGGNETLRLADVATLKLFAPYSLTSVTLKLDVVPIALPNIKNPAIQIEGAQITIGDGTTYTFDVGQNKRHEIAASGRAFIVTLLEVKKLDIAGVSNPIEYVFGISEK
jgi:hypothetical protein